MAILGRGMASVVTDFTDSRSKIAYPRCPIDRAGKDTAELLSGRSPVHATRQPRSSHSRYRSRSEYTKKHARLASMQRTRQTRRGRSKGSTSLTLASSTLRWWRERRMERDSCELVLLPERC